MPTDYALLRKLKDCKSVQKKVNAFFSLREKQKKPFIICGLARALGVSRMTLLNYEKNEKTSLSPEESKCMVDTIEAAKSRCEEWVEDSLFTGKSVLGSIFNLKNNYRNWKDKSEVEVDAKKPLLILK